MTPNASPFDVFVSYRWVDPDQTWVRSSLYPALLGAGLKVVLDVEDFVPGRDLILEMTRANRDSRHLLCVVSPEYFNGERMVHFEALMSRRSDPSGQRSSVIPLILRDVELPEWLRGLIPIDWTLDEHRSREWKKLLAVLSAPNDRVSPPGLCHLDTVVAASTPAAKPFQGPELPRSLSRAYELTGVFASGPANDIYGAQDPQGKPHLIKRIRNKAGYSKSTVEAVAALYDARSMQRRAAVPLSVVEGPDAFYELLEPIQGWTLADVMTQGRQSGVVGRLLEQWSNELLVAIRPLHEGGYVHRDLTPHNILVSSDSLSLVLLDFSSAVKAGSGGVAPLFSPGFSAPEQHEGIFGPFNDIYSIGALIHYLNRSSLPPPLETRRYGNPDLSLRGSVYRKLHDAVYSMLELDYRQRYPDAASALSAIMRRGTSEVFRPEIEGLLHLPNGEIVEMGYHAWSIRSRR